MDYEYGFIAEVLEIKASLATATTAELQKEFAVGLAGWVGRVTKSLPTIRPGGFEVVSHDLTRLEDRLLLSLLIRRPLQ